MTKPQLVKGDIFESQAQALVNPVNCVGVMGAGLAKEFKRRHPRMFAQYRKDCRTGLVRTGEVRLYPGGCGEDPRTIVNLPTKEDWRHPSRMEYVEAGLNDLRRKLTEEGYTSVAAPLLGTGLGGLDPREVLALMERMLDIPGVAPEIRVTEHDFQRLKGR